MFLKSLINHFWTKFFSCAFLLLTGNLSGQVNLGQPDVWVSHGNGLHLSQKPILGNHPVLDYPTVQGTLNKVASFSNEGLSLFLVVRPKYLQSKGKVFCHFKGIYLSDSALTYRGAGKSFQVNSHNPLILSISFPVKASKGRKVKASLIDTALFEVYEVVAYNRTFNRDEMRKMEAYLSLKYSIPTTKSDQSNFRSYPADSANQFYWNNRLDGIFDKEVVAIGNFPFSSLMQTQTLAYHQDSLIIALDSMVEFGAMPKSSIQEGAHLIFAKRAQTTASYSCELALNQSFPITAWRLRPINWQGSADSLRMEYRYHQALSATDTLILTNGSDTLNLKTQQFGSHLQLAFSLADLKNRLHING